MKMKEIIPVAVVAFSCLVGCVQPDPAAAQPTPSALAVDEHTLMLLRPQSGGLKDMKQAFEATVKGGTIVPDERFGQALQFGEAQGNGISVKDDGKLDFTRGLTLEMWLQLQQADEKTPNPGGQIFTKMGSFYTTIKDGKLRNDWMTFPTQEIFTTTDKQFKYYPVETEGFGGVLPLAPNRWTHVAVTYDPVVKVIRTWIDGSLDRTRYLVRQGEQPLQSNPRNALNFVSGMKNVRVGEIRVSNTARAINTLPPLETYVHALPYRKQVAVSLDHINPNALPLDIVLQWQTPNGPSSVLQRFPLTEAKRKDVVFTPPGWKAQYTLTVNAFSNNREVYSKSVRVINGDTTAQPVRIDEQNRFIFNGRPVFPLVAYHAFAEDFGTLGKMGFNIVTPRAPDSNFMGISPNSDEDIAKVRHYLDIAKENNVTLSVSGKSSNLRGVAALTDHPALAIWYGADEPWGKLEHLRDSYNAMKQLAPGHPILNVQNNPTRFQETAEGADILGCDPYPIPNVSLRTVADHTKAAIRAVGGLKPVWTVIPQYETKLPTEQELRCMAYLAISSGANGLGVYAWDDRHAKTKVGWYTGAHPEHQKILSTVIGELAKLEQVLLIPNSTRALTFAPANPALHVALKESAGESYLLVVNDSRKAEEATLTLAGLQSADGIDVHQAQEKLSIRDGKVLVQLPPLGTRLYKLSNISR